MCGCDVNGVDVGKDKSRGKVCVDVMLMVWMLAKTSPRARMCVCGCDGGGVVNGVVNDVVSVFEDEGEAVNPFCPSSALLL